jgi:HAD superfamily hydrolase (TIGR01544 family)
MLLIPPKLELLMAVTSNIHIADRERVLQKISTLDSQGADNLHIISDFDMTMTKYWHNGKRSISSHGVLELSKDIEPSLKLGLNRLYQKYYPIEISREIALPEKIIAMQDWWNQAHDLFIQARIRRDTFSQCVADNPVIFRDALKEFVSLCDLRKIPILVFSAGLADMLEVIFEKSGFFTPDITIIANKMEFNEHGECVGFLEPLIHVFNKNEAAIASSGHFEKILDRKNIVSKFNLDFDRGFHRRSSNEQ